MLKSLKRVFFLLFTIFFTFNSFSQNKLDIDSLKRAFDNAPLDTTRIEILVNLWRATAYSNPRQSLKYARAIIKESQALDFPLGLATGYQRLGISQTYLGHHNSVIHNYKKALNIYKAENEKALQGVMLYNIGLEFQNRSEYDSAIAYIKQAGELFEATGDSSRTGAVYDGLGAIAQEKGDYRIALQHFLKASEIFESSGDSMRMSIVYLEIGNSFHENKNYRNALKYYRQALNIGFRSNDLQTVTSATIGIGKTYNEFGKYDSTVLILKRSIILADSLESPMLLTDAVSGLAVAYLEHDNYQAALPLFKQGLKEARAKNYALFEASNLINIGWVYFHQNQLEQAAVYANEGLDMSLQTEVKENTKSAYELLSDIYAKQEDFKKAYTYHQKFKSINDSIYNTTKSGQINELQTLYETEKKENEITRQKETIQLLNQQARIEHLRKLLLIACLIAAIIIGALLIYSFRQKIKRERAEREKEKSDYERELTFRKKQLTTHTLHLVQKNELLESLSAKLAEIKKNATENKKELNRLLQLIKNDTQADKDWENFKMYFEQVHEDFDQKLRARINDLTNNEMRLAALMKMNLSTKEIATILNISPDSVNKARYRLRKKLDLSGDDKLSDFILAL